MTLIESWRLARNFAGYLTCAASIDLGGAEVRHDDLEQLRGLGIEFTSSTYLDSLPSVIEGAQERVGSVLIRAQTRRRLATPEEVEAEHLRRYGVRPAESVCPRCGEEPISRDGLCSGCAAAIVNHAA